jgi:2-C-methyl-D-erythritol 2,4-cyclodiphosphate synthase
MAADVTPSIRVGQGFDIHPFSADPARPLVLGGVTLQGEPGLQGHSDADVLSHALADALLGAAGLGDLGSHFPDTDAAYAGASSLGLLRHVVGMVAAEGLVAINADCTVVCERPRLSGHVQAIAASLGSALGAPVNVKATKAEGLGAIGRGEGIAALAVVLLSGSGAGIPGSQGGP